MTASPLPRCVAPGSHNKLSVHNTAVTFWQNMRMRDIYNIYSLSTISTISTQYLAVLIDARHIYIFHPELKESTTASSSMTQWGVADIVRPKLKVCCISIVINWAKLTRWDCGRVHSLVSLLAGETASLYCEAQDRGGPSDWILWISGRDGPQSWLLQFS